MPVRVTPNRRRRRSAHVTPEAIALFRQGHDLLCGEHDPYERRDIKIRLAVALGRSKFAACPLDREPRSLIGCDTEPVDVVRGLRRQLMKEIGGE
jgi:hypothetical protein